MSEKGEVQVVTLRIPHDEHDAIKAVAALAGRSVNQVLRDAVREYLTGPKRTEEFEQLVGAAQDQFRVALDKLKDL